MNIWRIILFMIIVFFQMFVGAFILIAIFGLNLVTYVLWLLICGYGAGWWLCKSGLADWMMEEKK